MFINSATYCFFILPHNIAKGIDNIGYIYSAAGEKLEKTMKVGTYQYYAGNMVYDNVKSLKYLLFDERMVNKSWGVYSYEYHLKDHPPKVGQALGNTRVTFQPDGSGTTTTQIAEYYPFGSSYLPVSPAGTNKYLYNGKEKQDDVLGSTALDWYDYGARFYDAQIGRWHVIDNKAEKYFFTTPYTYALNNPIIFTDPDGNDVKVSTIHNNATGRTTVTYTVTIRLENTTIFSKEYVNKRADGVKNQIEKSFSGSNEKTNTEYKTVVNFDSQEKDLKLSFVADIEGATEIGTVGFTDEIGNTKENRVQIELDGGIGGEALHTESETERTGAHEFGHVLG